MDNKKKDNLNEAEKNGAVADDSLSKAAGGAGTPADDELKNVNGIHPKTEGNNAKENRC